MMSTARLALTPRDGLFCKDGRGWQTRLSGHGLDWPWPSTMLGALRTAWGRGEEVRSGRHLGADDWRVATAAVVLGRSLALRRPLGESWAPAHRVWPAPADCRRLEDRGDLQQLDPVPPKLPTLGRDDDPAREALWIPVLDDKAKPHPVPRWWCEARFAAWLAGQAVPARDPANELGVCRRIQVHLGIQPDANTALDGALFSHDIVETLERNAEWSTGVEVVLADRARPALATLGSDSRLARIEDLPEQMFEPPAEVLQAFKHGPRGVRLVVVTPTCFRGGWLPDGIEPHGRELRGRIGALEGELVLRAAIVPRPVYISGWDMAAVTVRRDGSAGRGAPKSTSSMVPPGAVYFFERVDGRRFGELDARALWLTVIGARNDEGFGRVVPGIWNPTRSEL